MGVSDASSSFFFLIFLIFFVRFESFECVFNFLLSSLSLFFTLARHTEEDKDKEEEGKEDTQRGRGEHTHRKKEPRMSSSSSSSTSSSSAFVEFFAHLSEEKINHLYKISPWATLAVLRALTPLAKQYVMRCIFLPANHVVSHGMIQSWTKRGAESAHEMALERLVQLRAFVEVESVGGTKNRRDDDEKEEGGFIVHEHFRKHVKRAIERGFEDLDDEEEEQEEEKENEQKKKKKSATKKTTTTAAQFNGDKEFLDHYAKSRWETVLLELTSEASAEKKRKKKKMMMKKGGGGLQHALHLRKLFYAARLITKDGRITSEGFSFLLGATSEQIWILLARYARGGDFEKKNKDKTMKEKEEDNMDTSNGGDDQRQNKVNSDESSAAAMAFLVRLSFQHPGRKYSKANLSEAERRVASHLSALGVLYENEDDEKDNDWYVPTVLSAGLSSVSTTSSAKSALARIDGHIIVETNFRVYAYTHSELETEVLRLFTRPDYKLPNAYVGMITRDSILDAMRAGISPDQIVNYLQTRAHPRCTIGKKPNHPAVPPTVCDQIRLWARDLYRVKADDCVMYTDFPMQGNQFQDAVNNARNVGAQILWIDESKRRFAVDADSHERLKVFL